MYCPNCSKENETFAMFCSECGKPLQGDQDTKQNSNNVFLEEKTLNNPKKKKWVFFGVIVVAIFLFIMIVGSGTNDIEYTDNSGDKLPIVVNQISIQESGWSGFIDITFEIENLTQTDYKDVTMAVLAWDSEGYPIDLRGMYEFDFDSSYVSYIGLENVRPRKLDEYSYTFDNADIKYMSVFLSSYEDFKNKKWENPVTEDIEKSQGKKLNEMGISYFTFQ